jgi:hypothetical protein
MKPKPQEKTSKDSCRPKPGHWNEMNRKHQVHFETRCFVLNMLLQSVF